MPEQDGGMTPERSPVPKNISTSPPSPSLTRPRCPRSSIVRRGKNTPLLLLPDRLQSRFTHGLEDKSLPCSARPDEVPAGDTGG